MKILNLNYKDVIKNFNYTFEKGKIYGLYGTSGVGKTTLLKSIKGIIKYTGKITGNKKVYYLSQKETNFEWMTVLENIKFVYRLSDKNFDVLKVSEIMKIFNLDTKILNKRLNEVSSGEYWRISILKSVLVDIFDIYLFDESFANINEEYIIDIFCYLKRFAVLNDKIIIIVSHNKRLKEHFDEIIKL